VGGKGARLNLVVNIEVKAALERLAACYGVTLREAVRLAADQAETALLDSLSADQRAAYYRGELALQRNGNDAGRDQTIIRLFEAGKSKRGIARVVGCSDGTVRNVLRRHQVDAPTEQPAAEPETLACQACQKTP
jgi:predicted glycoside hydrolase/deacetylase ChbG (UPF0249 family)